MTDQKVDSANGASETSTGQDSWSSFRRLWVGSAATLYVEQFISFAIPLLLITQTGSSVAFGQFVTFLYFVPYLLVGLSAGVWLEGRSHTQSLNIAAAIQVLLILALLGAELTGTTSPIVYIAFVLASGFIAVFFQISFQSVLPQLLSRGDSLYLANSRLALSDAVTRVIGPASAGLLIAYLRPSGSLLFAAHIATLASVSFFLIRAPRKSPMQLAVPSERVSTMALVGEGLRYVKNHQWLNPIISCGAYYIIFITAIKATIVLYLVDSERVSAAVGGVIISAIAFGYGVGSFVGQKLTSHRGARTTLQYAALIAVTGASVSGAVALLVANNTLLAAACSTAMFIHGVGDGMFAPTALSVRQIATPDIFMSRVTSVHRFFIWGGMSLGGLVAAIVTYAASPAITLAVMSVGVWGTLPILYRRNLSIHTRRGVTYDCNP